MAKDSTPHQEGYKAGTQGKGTDANPHKEQGGFFAEVVHTLTRDALKTSDVKAAASWEKGRQEGAAKKEAKKE